LGRSCYQKGVPRTAPFASKGILTVHCRERGENSFFHLELGGRGEKEEGWGTRGERKGSQEQMPGYINLMAVDT